jgi:2-polyprenyl-3-methyl-5-hydroxy-6-metoxy-1,4-benzoquinol methylase
MESQRDLMRHKNTHALFDKAVTLWPEHAAYLTKSLNGHLPEELDRLERLSTNIMAVAGNELPAFVESYKWLCGIFNEEQIAFMRTGKYRRSSFADADAAVYANSSYMQKYMEGLLVSQLFWNNHAKSYLFHETFIQGLKPHSRYLEIGPGHGLYLATAALEPNCEVVEAWDVSEESLLQTEASTRRMGVTKPVRLVKRDVVEAGIREEGAPTFDVIVICEVLEHLEYPARALDNLRSLLAPGGRILVNFPINSPAPDHIYLLESLEAVESMIKNAGFRIEAAQGFPTTGYSLKRAMATRATVSCAVIGVI